MGTPWIDKHKNNHYLGRRGSSICNSARIGRVKALQNNLFNDIQFLSCTAYFQYELHSINGMQ